MSRKRSSGQTHMDHNDHHGAFDGNEYDSYEYYSPGCYCTPQVVEAHPTPYICTHMQQYPVQCHCCTAATYVVDAFGNVYYLSDFEHQLQLPGHSVLETEITYHYQYDKDECEDDIDDDAGVSPRKRERLEENDIDNDAEVLAESQLAITSAGESKKVYRADEGYLVEEPSDDTDEPPTK